MISTGSEVSAGSLRESECTLYSAPVPGDGSQIVRPVGSVGIETTVPTTSNVPPLIFRPHFLSESPSVMEENTKVYVPLSGEEPYDCTTCSKTFSYKKTLARHVRNEHSIFGKPCICEYCKSRFNDKWALRKHIGSTHMKKHHIVICPICRYKDSKIMIDIHFAEVHNITVEEEFLHFSTLEEFEKWKNKVERSTVARFVVSQKFKKKSGAVRIIYNCHRSGFFKPRGKNKRNIKSQGTNKIMGFCPARLEFESMEKKGVKVQFIKTHVGHENEEEKVFSQYELRYLKKPVTPNENQTKCQDNNVVKIQETRIPIHLISNYCQIVDGGSLIGVGDFEPVMTFNNNNNVISIIRTTTTQDGRSSNVLEDMNSSMEETATLHSGTTVINLNSITTLDLASGDIRLETTNLVSNSLDKDGNEDLTCETLTVTNTLQCDPFTGSLDLNKLLSGRLDLDDVKLPEEDCDDSTLAPRTDELEALNCDDLSNLDTTKNPMDPDSDEATLLKIPPPSVIMSSEAAQLSYDKQLLIDRFRDLIEAVETREIFWEMKKICVPAMETMKSLFDQKMYESIPYNKPEK